MIDSILHDAWMKRFGGPVSIDQVELRDGYVDEYLRIPAGDDKVLLMPLGLRKKDKGYDRTELNNAVRWVLEWVIPYGRIG